MRSFWTLDYYNTNAGVVKRFLQKIRETSKMFHGFYVSDLLSAYYVLYEELLSKDLLVGHGLAGRYKDIALVIL